MNLTSPLPLLALALAAAVIISANCSAQVSPEKDTVTQSRSPYLQERLNVRDFGAKCDGVADDTAALLRAKAYAIAHLPITIRFPKGTCVYSDLGNLAYSGLTLAGESHRETVLKFTGKGSALLADAFVSGAATAPFVQPFNLRDLTVEGNANTASVIRLQGIARSNWSNVFVRVAEPTAGIAFDFRGVMLSKFDNIGSSTDLDRNMISKPYEGLRLSPGTRAGKSVGNSSNNIFISAYMEGLAVGIRLAGADQNTFLSGAAEANSIYDLLVATGSRYNSFLGVGFESTKTKANIVDAGISTSYLNCYANNKVLLAGRSAEMRGGYYQRIEIQPGAARNRIESVTVKHWENSFPGTGGIFDSGKGTATQDVFDAVGGKFTPSAATRSVLAVKTSPFSFENTSGHYVEVVLETGTVSEVRIWRGNDSWRNPTSIPGKHLLAPSDRIQVSFSSTPSISVVPHVSF